MWGTTHDKQMEDNTRHNGLCLCETHLEGNENINIDDYEFISNRKVKHKNAPKFMVV